MESESNEIQNDQHRRKRMLSMTEIMREVIPIILECFKHFVLYFPSRSSASRQFDDVPLMNWEIRHKAIVVCDFPIGVNNFHFKPIDVHSFSAVTQWQIAYPTIIVRYIFSTTSRNHDFLAMGGE